MRRLLLLSLLAALLAPAARAGGFITLKDGSIVQGMLVSCSDTELCGIVEPTGEERTFQRDDLRPSSWYMVRNRTAADDAQARLTLAKFCLEHDLFGSAKHELEKVYDLDESLREEAIPLWHKANEAAAKSLIGLAENALKRGQLKTAKRLASKILTEFAGTSAQDRADEILDEVVAKQAPKKSMDAVVHQPLNEAQVEKLAKDDPRAVEARERLERARKRNQKGLKERSQSAGKNAFEASISEYKHVRRLADKVMTEEKDEPLIVKRVEDFKAMVTDEMVEVYVNLAAVDAGRSSYPNAMKTVSAGLAEVPDNARLKSYRQHVETLQAYSAGDGRWGRRR